MAHGKKYSRNAPGALTTSLKGRSRKGLYFQVGKEVLWDESTLKS